MEFLLTDAWRIWLIEFEKRGLDVKVCVTSLLRDRGFKVTPQRLAIYSVLEETKEHPSAEMIFSKLQPTYPTMSLATVYKTIEILKEIDLVQILNVGEDSFRYDADTSNHAHVRCTSCGRVDDLYGIDPMNFVSEVASRTEYQLSGQQFYFFGVCPDCQTGESAGAQKLTQ